MDIVYVLGNGSKWQNNEIKYSIRSLMLNCRSFRRILIIGADPGIFHYDDRLIFVPAPDNHKKEINIWNKVLRACQLEALSDDFLFINDDHFMLKPFHPEAYPFYAKGNLADKHYSGSDTYQMVLKATRNVLQKHGLNTWHFDIHTPILFNKEKFIRTHSYFSKYLEADQELVMKSCYANLHGIKPTLMNDLKLTRGCSLQELAELFQKRHVLSVADEAITSNFRRWLQFHFPEPSPWEIGAR
jgi:hypothetical protein